MIAELRDVSKRYGKILALNKINLKIREGEILAIIGNSGAGKTTLLRILAMLERPSEGKYYYRGEEANDRVRGKITMVFQKPVMFNTSVYNNVAYGLKLRGYSKKEVDERVAKALNMMGLDGYARHNAKRLSGGEQQRVAIARAIVIEPEMLVLDEPTANLDPSNVVIIEKIIKDIACKGVTVVLATHNLFQAKRLADRTAFIFNGKLVEIGETKKIFESPENELTKKFISGELYF
ncbi:phosphate ABC transporter ATP-binding protein, PhoT family [Archaeoglobus sulfaticallidus PM70-1]|uniref:Phosphate ABC transporter ATP-binding protein, PhoT family n=1 Tax=Archaeoglobus sulfaticallidus PM70-1 TaxID=387631 RepID=N0BK94_9EURY|nr:phosphate ABC transporter ATP-binding protein [Archaeoglobus sulfaticallidus]AGK60565.1 phosphate ABC transporter ATP-binding protein, PhoT family [Archaeoglobus sulfaticallidus PM70-1]